ncbi:hypothetical protein B0T22DRAFT_454566 [Podospora appendiculata]|uniref:DNA 3'-5' helicase n=1 Tax=Podospora appendiculata TaxID=314037 RepID=A0AAE0XL32_9PEZI|nr:hypothetical protein B0T22DRAFT_454566 [Podospora appendiculata]
MMSSVMSRTNSETIEDGIAAIKMCSDMVKGDINGIPATEVIAQLLQETRNPDKKDMQLLLIRTITDLLLNFNVPEGEPVRCAEDGQIEAIHRLVYTLGDIILIARTGYGKSIIFQALTLILTGKVVIQIIPLSKLGEEQRDIIASFPSTNPVLITDSVVKDKQFWAGLEQPGITNILVGPEQASHYRFLALMRKASFNQRIAFIGIDELHMVHQWRDFRTDYARLRDLRLVVPSSVPIFGCTATLTAKAQDFVLRSVGFRSEGTALGQLRIIRTSVDSKNIQMIIQCLRRGEMRGLEGRDGNLRCL